MLYDSLKLIAIAIVMSKKVMLLISYQPISLNSCLCQEYRAHYILTTNLNQNNIATN